MPKWTSGQARKETSVEDVNTCPHQHPGRLSQTRTVVVERDCDSPVSGGDDPDSPPLPLPPPNPDNRRRSVLGSFGALRIGAITPRGAGPRSLVSTRSSPTGSQSENEGYNSSDEHMPCFPPSRPGSTSTWIESRYKLLLRLSKNIRLIMQALVAEGRYYSDLELTLILWNGPISHELLVPPLMLRRPLLELAMEAYSIFEDDVDSIVCYVLETSCGSNNRRRKGKTTE
ncbi:hypothetical protein Rs2_17057 [Raphanus sativus]|nr:hypothetical protein Rs2_17057 [Raphanus sativus]